MDAGSARTEAGGTLASREPGEPGGLKTLRVSFFGITVPGGLTVGRGRGRIGGWGRRREPNPGERKSVAERGGWREFRGISGEAVDGRD